MGCWAIGEVWTFKGGAAGWDINDGGESICAFHAAPDKGVDLFDTAANYGYGHSERVPGRAIHHCWEQVVVATKFGYQVNEATKDVQPYDGDEENGDVTSRIRSDCYVSLPRLDADHINVYLLHV